MDRTQYNDQKVDDDHDILAKKSAGNPGTSNGNSNDSSSEIATKDDKIIDENCSSISSNDSTKPTFDKKKIKEAQKLLKQYRQIQKQNETKVDSQNRIVTKYNFPSNGIDYCYDLNFLRNGYDWSAFYPTHDKECSNDISSGVILISKYHYNVKKGLCDADLIRRCDYLGWARTRDNYDKCYREITSHIYLFKEQIKNLIQAYFIDLAIKLNFQIQNRYAISNFDDFLSAVRQISNYSDARKVLMIIYLSFDFLPGYRDDLGDAILTHLNFRMLDAIDSENDENEDTESESSVAKHSFMYKLVSKIINEQRKIINNHSINSCGLQYTITRTKRQKEEAKGKSRELKTFYPWMINGVLVSIFKLCIG